MPSVSREQHIMWLHKFFNEKSTENEIETAREFLEADKEQGLYQEETDGRVLVIFIDKDKFLLLDHKKIGKWTFPIGKIDKGEYPYITCQREMYEELGIIVRKADDLKIKGLKGPLNPNAHFHVFKVTHYDGKITNKEPEKHKALKWFTVDQIVKMIEQNEVDKVTADCLSKLNKN